MADTTIDLLKNSSYVGKMDELIAAVKLGSGATSDVEWDNVKNKPTTIGGYGIIDAKIDNGTITLGNQTITPLTSAPVTSVNNKTGAVTLSASDVSAIPSTLTGTTGQVLTKTSDGQEWKDVAIPSGTNDHSKLSNRDAADQHPIGAITGLEAALANIPPTDAFIVTLTQAEAGTYSVDKTFAEIQAAIQSNRTVYLYAQYASMFLSLVFRIPEVSVVFGYVSTSSTGVHSIFVVVYNDDHVEIQQKGFSELPNPNSLTFTGAVTGSYDGSAPLSVEIPSGGGGSGWELVSDTTLSEDVSQLEYTGLNCYDLRVAIYGRWNDADDSLSNANINANILLNESGGGYQYSNGQIGYIRPSGTNFHTLIEATAANAMYPKVVVSLLPNGGAVPLKSQQNTFESQSAGISWSNGKTEKINRILIVFVTSGAMLKSGSRIIVMKRS